MQPSRTSGAYGRLNDGRTHGRPILTRASPTCTAPEDPKRRRREATSRHLRRPAVRLRAAIRHQPQQPETPPIPQAWVCTAAI